MKITRLKWNYTKNRTKIVLFEVFRDKGTNAQKKGQVRFK